MLKYFLYIWNLLKATEKLELLYHFGQCMLSAFLYTIIDWQYIILIWIMTNYGTDNILNTIVIVQLFTWVISFWYHYVKYKITLKQNYFYKIVSSRHYHYILNRVSKNASYEWLFNKSPLELSKHLDLTEKGLQYIIGFVTHSFRLLAMILFSVSIVSWQYKSCILMFIVFFILLYVVLNRKGIFVTNDATRQKFQLLNTHNSLIISDNIAILLDSILHNDYQKIITNIITFNDITKTEQIKIYNHEDQTYTKIGMILISGYLAMLMSTSYIMNFAMNEFTLFFIAALLTYKCISRNIMDICDMYCKVRQTDIDFNCLVDIWENTLTNRDVIEQTVLPTQNPNHTLLKDYYSFHYQKIESIEIALYDKFLIDTVNKTNYDTFSKTNLLKLTDAYFLCNKEELKKLQNIKDFIVSKTIYIDQFATFLENNTHTVLKTAEKDIYFDYLTSASVVKNISAFKLKLSYIQFYYDTMHSSSLSGIQFKGTVPITIKSNSHILIDGPSGSGKTTFLKIIRGIIPLDTYDATLNTTNAITLALQLSGGAEVAINFTNISNAICYCQQNTVNFIGGTMYQILSDNYITTTHESENVILMNKALATACVDAKFRDLKFKCSKDTISGGQKQRIALAKNLYRIFKENKQILIFDEIDIGLDVRTAEKIIVNLNLVFKEKMMFIVLHTTELKTLFKNKININDGIISYTTS